MPGVRRRDEPGRMPHGAMPLLGHMAHGHALGLVLGAPAMDFSFFLF